MIIRDPLNPRWRSRTAGRVLQEGRAQPIGRRTARIRQNFSRKSQYTLVRLSNQWRGLSEAQRAQWESFGATWPQTDKYGFTVYWNGWLWFQKLNFMREQFRVSINTTPPADPTPTYEPALGSVAYDVDGNITLTLSEDPAAFEVVSFFFNANTTSPGSPFKWPATAGPSHLGPASSPLVAVPAGSFIQGLGWVQIAREGYDSAGKRSIRTWTSLQL
jgi:hypothetical protein